MSELSLIICEWHPFHWLSELFLDLLYPPLCVECERLTKGPPLCLSCYQKIEYPWQQPSLKLEPLYLDYFYTATLYQKPITTLIRQMKYKRLAPLAPFAGQLLYDSVFLPLPNVVTSVPLHPDRQRWRGFNQSELIAKEFAEQTHKPYCSLLTRTTYRPNQATLKHKQQRLMNLENVFALSSPRELPAHILIIDDVATTGTTLNECAKILKQNGVKKVGGLTLSHGF